MPLTAPAIVLAFIAAACPLAAQNVATPVRAGSPDRVRWFAAATAGPASTIGGLITSGYGVLTHQPPEYPPNTTGFGQRFGMRLTGVATGNAINASLGAIWGEDPRYARHGGPEFGGRLKRIIGHTFVTRYSDGQTRFAWARLAGNVGNNSLSNLWRVHSEVGAAQTAKRISFGVLGQMAGNAFAEFWPGVRKKFRKR
ncbi:MAG: hypothetical protein C0504_09580 [Candidatus Solibacter sp.]|nr:hypothetical protein [Candidatus Solibacter sp.]